MTDILKKTVDEIKAVDATWLSPDGVNVTVLPERNDAGKLTSYTVDFYVGNTYAFGFKVDGKGFNVDTFGVKGLPGLALAGNIVPKIHANAAKMLYGPSPTNTTRADGSTARVPNERVQFLIGGEHKETLWHSIIDTMNGEFPPNPVAISYAITTLRQVDLCLLTENGHPVPATSKDKPTWSIKPGSVKDWKATDPGYHASVQANGEVEAKGAISAALMQLDPSMALAMQWMASGGNVVGTGAAVEGYAQNNEQIMALGYELAGKPMPILKEQGDGKSIVAAAAAVDTAKKAVKA